MELRTFHVAFATDCPTFSDTEFAGYSLVLGAAIASLPPRGGMGELNDEAHHRFTFDSWFRVRFGSFTSRAEAESEAIRRGFREPWIARIR